MSSGKGSCRCPFFRSKGGASVCCEGFADDNTVSVRFLERDKLEQHWECYCCTRYDYCEIYRMVMEAKYEDME